MAGAGDDELAALDVAASDHVTAGASEGRGTFLADERVDQGSGVLLGAGEDPDTDAEPDDAEARIARQAVQQSDHHDPLDAGPRERDPEY